MQSHRANSQRFAARRWPALVHANPISSDAAIAMLAPQIPVLTHVHKLEFAFHANASPALSRLPKVTHTFIACSNAVRDFLLAKHRVPPASVETVYESIPVDHIRAERTRQQVFRELCVPDAVLLVVGSGFGQCRKGTPVFVQLARIVPRQRSNAYFAWIAGLPVMP